MGRPGSLGNPGVARSGETALMSGKAASVCVWGVGRGRVSRAIRWSAAAVPLAWEVGSERAKQGATYTGKEPGQGDPKEMMLAGSLRGGGVGVGSVAGVAEDPPWISSSGAWPRVSPHT